MRRFALILVVTVALMGQALPITPKVVLANRTLQDRQGLNRHLRNYQILELDARDVAREVGQSGQLSLHTPDGELELSLLPHDIRSANYRSDEVRKDGKVYSPERAPAFTYKGTVHGMSGAQARFTMNGNTVEGIVITRSQKYFIEPAARYSASAGQREYVVYRESDVNKEFIEECPGTLSAELSAELKRGSSLTLNSSGGIGLSALSPLREAEIATEADNEYVQALGSPQAANNEILSVLNMVDGVYQTEIGMTLKVVYQRAWDPGTADPYSDTTDGPTLLMEVRSYWNSNPPSNAPARDLAHLFTGRSLNMAGIAFGARPGIANDGVVCRDALYVGGSVSYGVSRRYNHTNLRVVIPAHEIGHNLGASHPDQESPSHSECNTTIMNSDGTFSNQTFCQFSRDQIINNINANGYCLDVATAPPPSIQFSNSAYSVTEGTDQSVEIAVNRSNGSGSSTVAYDTVNQSAADRSDFTTARGYLTFAPGETSKTFRVFLTDDVFAEGSETFEVVLSNPTGAILNSPSSATVIIGDNESTDGANPVKDATFNPEFFVRQHYVDFLNREADAPGLAFWVGQFNECDARPISERPACREMRRINVSASFFLSIEFQETGFYVIRMQRVAFGRRSNTSTSRVMYSQFIRDSRQVGDGVVVGQTGYEQLLEQNKQTYAQQMVVSPEFEARFPGSQSASEFVDALYASAGVTPSSTERQDAISAFNSGGRVAALRRVADSDSVRQAELNTSFVLMQFYGYLRRNPTDAPDLNDNGYQFWLSKLLQFNGNFVAAEMVQAFLMSGEFQHRFGP